VGHGSRDAQLPRDVLLPLARSLQGRRRGRTGPAYPAEIKLPDGFFKIAVYAEVPWARSLALGADGTVYVGTRAGDKVHAVRDEDGDHVAETIVTVIASEGLDTPNGVAYRDGDAVHRRGLADPQADRRGIDGRLEDPPAPRWSCATTSRATPTTAGSSSRSGPTASCTSRSARRATCASRTTSATRRSCG
jgi:hypothetical protein